MKVLVLDGGMVRLLFGNNSQDRRTTDIGAHTVAQGTTLEALGHDVSSPMWGCELVERNPGVVADVHARYVAAGADLIETAT
jgi:methionine synthase I (cobalamin-dependent)